MKINERNTFKKWNTFPQEDLVVMMELMQQIQH